VAPVEVWVSWRASRVHDALARLIEAEGTPERPAYSWTGPQREIGRVAGYASRSVIDGIAELEDCGLLLRQAQGNGRLLTYYLRAASSQGEAYLIRVRQPAAPTGRDAVRGAGEHVSRRVEPLPSMTQQQQPDLRSITQPIAQSPLDREIPSLSSESSSGGVLHDAAASSAAAGAAPSPAAPPPPPSRPLTPAEVGVAARLRALRIEPDRDVVERIAAMSPLQGADLWRRVETWGRPEGSTVNFVRGCIASVLEVFPDDPSPAPTGALEEAPQPAPVVVAVTKPLANPQPMTLRDVLSTAQAALVEVLRRKRR
jgi:hypothetical protein